MAEATNPIIAHPERIEATPVDPAERLCLDFFDDVWARGNADRIDHYLSPDFTYNPPPGYSGDRDGYRALVEDLHRAFPDMYADLEEVVAGNGRLAAHWIMEGTHAKEFMGIASTGRRVRFEGMALDTVRDGRIVHEYVAQDMLDAFVRMGAIDPDALSFG